MNTLNINTLKRNKPNQKLIITKTKHFCKIPAIQEFILTQQIGEQNNCPKELINVIKRYNSVLRNKTFEEIFSESYMAIWDDFSIPRGYNQLLTPVQLDSLKFLFYHDPRIVTDKKRTSLYYLYSKEQYKTLVTIPIELRRYLTNMPKSVKQELMHPNPDDKINKHCSIRVYSKNKTKEKLIIPEEKGII